MLCDTKFKTYCLGFLVSKFQCWDRNINIFLAITSSGSIAAWAIWELYPMLWATIIAISQVLTAIKPYFPFFKYVKELNAKNYKMELINIDIERLWYKLSKRNISEEEAEEQYFDLRRQIGELLNFGDDAVYKATKKIEQKANERMKIFLKNNYGIDININN